MTERKTTDGDGAQEAPAKAAPKKRYSHERLMEAASEFGVRNHVVAAALEGENRATLTADEARKRINDWLGR